MRVTIKKENLWKIPPLAPIAMPLQENRIHFGSFHNYCLDCKYNIRLHFKTLFWQQSQKGEDSPLSPLYAKTADQLVERCHHLKCLETYARLQHQPRPKPPQIKPNIEVCHFVESKWCFPRARASALWRRVMQQWLKKLRQPGKGLPSSIPRPQGTATLTKNDIGHPAGPAMRNIKLLFLIHHIPSQPPLSFSLLQLPHITCATTSHCRAWYSRIHRQRWAQCA